ncbi:MAG: serine hydrolase domain-containing protein, partial [Bacteroidota bacterium]
MIIKRVLVVIFLLAIVRLHSQEISEAKKDSLRKILYQHTNEDSPGLALGIVKDGQVVYENYLGLANLEHKINIDQNTRFSIASNAKQFTALCILKLMEAGKVDLEDDIRKYLPDLYKSIPDRITIAQLINHTSGTRDYGELWGLQGRTWYEEFLNNKDVIALLKGQTALNFKPGTDHLYSNTNYILLAEIVKKVSGQKFSTFAKALFEALGMPGSSFQTNYMDIIPFLARPYAKWNTWKEYPSISGLHADGALFTTLRDQLQWEQIVQNNNG